MKKLLFVAVLILAVAAGTFFINRMGNEPLRVDIARTMQMPDGSMNIYFTVSNRTAQPRDFLAYAQILSNGRWVLDDRAGKPIGTIERLPGETGRGSVARASDRPGPRRLQIKYDPAKSPGREKIDKLLQKIHLGPLPFSSELREFTTPPFNLPPR